MPTKRIAVDLDGVCFDFVSAIRQWLQDAGYPCVGGPTSWRFYEDDWNITQKEFYRQLDHAVDCGLFLGKWNCGHLIPGTADALYELAQGYDLVAVTSRWMTKNAWMDTVHWMDRLKLPFSGLVFTDRKGGIGDILIDDRPKFLHQQQVAGGDAILFQHGRKDQRIMYKQADNWPDIIKLVKELEND